MKKTQQRDYGVSTRLGMCCHLPAGFGTPPTGLGATLHVGVILKPLAILSTLRADLITNTAGSRMLQGAAKHEIGAGLANLGAIQQQPDMVGLAMPASLL